jgi:hypothetical protein
MHPALAEARQRRRSSPIRIFIGGLLPDGNKADRDWWLSFAMYRAAQDESLTQFSLPAQFSTTAAGRFYRGPGPLGQVRRPVTIAATVPTVPFALTRISVKTDRIGIGRPF